MMEVEKYNPFVTNPLQLTHYLVGDGLVIDLEYP